MKPLELPETLEPLELTHPELAEAFRLVAEGTHPTIGGISIHKAYTLLFMKDGSRRKICVLEPNYPYHCDSGKKFKKCCMNKPEPKLICRFRNKEVKGVKDATDTTTCRCYDSSPSK